MPTDVWWPNQPHLCTSSQLHHHLHQQQTRWLSSPLRKVRETLGGPWQTCNKNKTLTLMNTWPCIYHVDAFSILLILPQKQ